MLDYKRKTLDDSYLYSLETARLNRILADYIINAQRIDKSSPAFSGILEDVKRMQKSSILYTVLMMDDVELCIGKTELSLAFKVFTAKDIKFGKNADRKVFIDVTALVSLNNGYFQCKKIDKLISYLFAALAHLLYQKSGLKLLNNSGVTISATDCFMNMVDYIIDYLRIIGYSQNRAKILYLTGLYFQYNLMGKDIDTYAKNIAAKSAGISTNDTRAFDLYYKAEEDFANINSFINMITETFKLKGLTTEVFVGKWMQAYGTGTQFGMELFSNFATMLIYTYCGSYIINQKQIERCCGKSMVSFGETILKIGIDEFDNRAFMTEMELDQTIARDKNTMALAEAFLKRKKVPNDCKVNPEDYASKEKIKEKVKSIIEYYKASKQENKISGKLKIIAFGASGAMGEYITNGKNVYEIGVLEVILKESLSYFNDHDKNQLYSDIKSSSESFDDSRRKKAEDKEAIKRITSSLVELRKCLTILK